MKLKCLYDEADYLRVNFENDEDGDVRFETCGANFIRITPEQALRLSKKLKKHARKYIPKEATIS
ncbi:Uncharacterised protein [Streptococcus pneumoniae]|nr:Uncharacterised protein [Streptococcus pneumoniae]